VYSPRTAAMVPVPSTIESACSLKNKKDYAGWQAWEVDFLGPPLPLGPEQGLAQVGGARVNCEPKASPSPLDFDEQLRLRVDQ
jgi:hypothetical protein